MSTIPRPRVLHVGKFYPPFRGGMETHLQALCHAIRDRVDVQVLVANDERRTVRSDDDGVPVTRVASLGIVASTPICPGMPAALRAADADIVHLHHPNPMSFLAWALSGRRGRLVVTYHSDIVQQRFLGHLYAPLLHHVLGRADAIIATSPGYAAGSAVLRRHAARTTIIPLGARPPAPAAPADVAGVKAQYGERIVLSVGRLVYYKGLEHLIRAMQHVPATLLIIGDGPLRESLDRLVDALSLRNRVILLGPIEDLTRYYQAATVFALPSCERSEAFGIVQLEAMAGGTPVVNTALGTGVELVSPDGVSGLTVAPSDPAALATALNRILDDPSLRERLGSAARQRARDEFSDGVMADRTVELYRSVLRDTRA